MGKNSRHQTVGKGAKALFAFMALTSFWGRGSAAAAAGEPIQEIVITATRTKNDRKLIPQTVDVLTQKDFAKWGAQTVEDALKRVSNLDLTPTSMQGQSSQVTHQVSLRGMGNKGTLILVDGRRLAGEDAPETINGYELRRINLHDVDRIEVLRGAASALYGSDAVGGVIQIFTRKGRAGTHECAGHKGQQQMFCLNAHQEGHNAGHGVPQDFKMRRQRAAFHNDQRPDHATQ